MEDGLLIPASILVVLGGRDINHGATQLVRTLRLCTVGLL